MDNKKDPYIDAGTDADEKADKNAANNAGTATVTMDINRYLLETEYGKSIADMLRVLFKGQLATKTEWDKKTEAVIGRRAD